MVYHLGAQVLHGQSDVVGGDSEQTLQLSISTQVDSVGLQESPQRTVAHKLHDQDVRLCTEPELFQLTNSGKNNTVN